MIKINNNVVGRQIADENIWILYKEDNGMIFEVNNDAGYIFDLIGKGLSRKEILNNLQEVYVDHDMDDLNKNLNFIIENFLKYNILVEHHE